MIRILYFAFGIVHARNLGILCRGDDSIRGSILTFRDVFETYPNEDVWKRFPPLFVEDIESVERVLSSTTPDAVLMSKLYGDEIVAKVLAASYLAGVPVIGFQEVNQMALTSGSLNTCWFEADAVCLASRFEQLEFLKLGFSPGALQVTGWPFAPFDEVPVQSTRDKHVTLLGKNPKAKIALLTLSKLDQRRRITGSGEYPETRKRILEIVCSSLPEDWLLAIKPHPFDRPEDVESFIPPAKGHLVRVLPPGLDFAEALGFSDLLINRGNSQVIVQAMMNRTPVVCIPVGEVSVLAGHCPECLVDNEQQFKVLLGKLERGEFPSQEGLLQEHSPCQPREARTKALDVIAKTAIGSSRRTEARSLGLAILVAHHSKNHQKALQFLSRLNLPVSSLSNSVERLLKMRAKVSDVAAILEGMRLPAVPELSVALWMRQKFLGRERVADEDLYPLLRLTADTPNLHSFLPELIAASSSFKRHGGRFRQHPAVEHVAAVLDRFPGEVLERPDVGLLRFLVNGARDRFGLHPYLRRNRKRGRAG